MYGPSDILKAAVVAYGEDGELLLAKSALANTAGLELQIDDVGAQIDLYVSNEISHSADVNEFFETRLLKTAVANFGVEGRLRIGEPTIKNCVGKRLLCESYPGGTQYLLRLAAEDVQVLF